MNEAQPPRLPGEKFRHQVDGAWFAVAPWLSHAAIAWAWVGPDGGDTWVDASDVGETVVIETLRAWALALEAERDEARAWVRRLTQEHRVLTCAFCGEAYPPGTPESNHEALTAHVKVCTKHPMREVGRELASAREALRALRWRVLKNLAWASDQPYRALVDDALAAAARVRGRDGETPPTEPEADVLKLRDLLRDCAKHVRAAANGIEPMAASVDDLLCNLKRAAQRVERALGDDAPTPHPEPEAPNEETWQR